MNKGRIAFIVAAALAAPLVAHFEGYSPKAYLDPVGIPTVCYGYTHGVEIGMVKDRAECEALLEGELAYAVNVVARHVVVPLPDTRRAALASFIYNVGESNFKYSTLLRKLNAGQTVAACDQLRKWVYAKGRKLPGLVRRREAERELCLMEVA